MVAVRIPWVRFRAWRATESQTLFSLLLGRRFYNFINHSKVFPILIVNSEVFLKYHAFFMTSVHQYLWIRPKSCLFLALLSVTWNIYISCKVIPRSCSTQTFDNVLWAPTARWAMQLPFPSLLVRTQYPEPSQPCSFNITTKWYQKLLKVKPNKELRYILGGKLLTNVEVFLYVLLYCVIIADLMCAFLASP